MFHNTNHRTPRLRRVAVLCTLLLLLFSFALPASAAPPQDLQFAIQVTYALGNFTTVGGDWSSAGIFASVGDAVQTARHAGWPGNGWQFQTAHFTTTLSDGNGTITIQDQSTQIEWTGGDSTGSGHWVIHHASGAYAHLHGRGTSTWQATFHGSCPDASVTGPCIIIEMQLTGSGHIN
jgi:hypothetical protein